MIKTFLRKLTPGKLLFFRYALLNYYYDFKRFIKYSSSREIHSKTNLEAKIVMDCHTIEKGLTMPEPRLGFGKDLLFRLIGNCEQFLIKYGSDDEQLKHTVSVLLEYLEFHKNKNFGLNDMLIKKIKNLSLGFSNLTPTNQIDFTIEEYFSSSDKSFLPFSKSRHSVRNYIDENIDINLIEKSIEITQATTPSACNRQTSRAYLLSKRETIDEILKYQSGNRGFGHLSNKLIVLTAELGVFDGLHERNQAYIDGGMFAMNLLYALHSNKIATCILNCSHDFKKDKIMRKLCGIKDSEVFIAMIACGIPPANFKITISNRYNYLDILNMVKD